MEEAVSRHAGATYIVITDLNSYRLPLAAKMGVTLSIDPTKRTLGEVQKELGMVEGFDVGFEMSGNPAAFPYMIANMSHGAKLRNWEFQTGRCPSIGIALFSTC
jgi:threonine 3-dehydrogenase